VSFTLKFLNDKGEMEDQTYVTEQLDAKRTSADFAYSKHFTCPKVNEHILYYWLKNNVR